MGAGRGPPSSSSRHRPLSPPQVLTGVLLALAGLVQFFECAVVAEPPDCAAAAPGVRDHWLVDAAFYLWLQARREGWAGGGAELLGVRRQRDRRIAFAPAL